MNANEDFVIFESKLKQLRSLDELLTQYAYYCNDESLNSYLNKLLISKNTTKSKIYTKTQMGRTFLYQIFSGKRNPSRNKLLQIAIALQCSLLETQNLLCLSKHSILNFRNKHDIIIAYGLYRKYDAFTINETLYDYNESPLFNEK